MNKYFDETDIRFFKITTVVGVVVFSLALALL
jgi:hypothetical protein